MRSTVWGIAALAVALAACELFVKIPDDATGGVPDSGSVITDGAPGNDGATAEGGNPSSDSGSSTDAGVESDASWQFVSTDGNTGSSDDGGAINTVTVSISSPLKVGDLVVVGCSCDARGGPLKVGAPDGFGMLAPVGPFTSGAGGFEVEVLVGTVAKVPAGGLASLTFGTTSDSVSFLDCAVDVYRGGTSAWTVVDTKLQAGNGAGLVSCGPVATAPRGVASYDAVRFKCAGAPGLGFAERQDLQGNPVGDSTPTDGGTAQTQLAQCEDSDGEWACLTVSVAP